MVVPGFALKPAVRKILELIVQTSRGIYRLTLVLVLITGLAACAGKDKQEKTPDQMTEQLRQETLKYVTDSDRANKAAELTEQLRQIFVEAHEQSKTDIETYRAINANFDATEADFKAFFESINNKARNRHGRVLAIHSKLKTLLTEEEWKKLNDARKDALKTDLNLL